MIINVLYIYIIIIYNNIYIYKNQPPPPHTSGVFWGYGANPIFTWAFSIFSMGVKMGYGVKTWDGRPRIKKTYLD